MPIFIALSLRLNIVRIIILKSYNSLERHIVKESLIRVLYIVHNLILCNLDILQKKKLLNYDRNLYILIDVV